MPCVGHASKSWTETGAPHIRDPVRRPENRQAVFPQTALTGADNVTNPLAERFYREHGVETVEAGYDLNDRFDGVRVMRMRYCLRREIGQCLRERPDYRGRLLSKPGVAVTN